MANWTRRLDSGTLPVLCIDQVDGPITYKITAFATLEKGPTGMARVEGTAPEHFYPCTSGNMLSGTYTPGQSQPDGQERGRRFANRELYADAEQVVLWCRIMVVNTGAAPQYAAIRAPMMLPCVPHNRTTWKAGELTYNGSDGYSMDRSRVYSVNRIDGYPIPAPGHTFMVYPEHPVAVDFIMPHSPIEPQRAAALSSQRYDDHLEAVRTYWQAKADEGHASITVPEKKRSTKSSRPACINAI